MKKSNKGILIVGIILGFIAFAFALLAILYAFNVNFVVDLEWYIITKWEWSGFNLLLWSLIIMAVFVLALIIMLVVSDDKIAKSKARTRRVNKYFE